jgi:arsenate reductase
MITLYGIPNCDTVKKARTWLDENGHAYSFHDFKKAGLDKTTVASWLTQVPWETLVNKKGLTWRGLDDATKASVVNATSATKLMLNNTSVIKRPVLCADNQVLVGFDPALYEKTLQA